MWGCSTGACHRRVESVSELVLDACSDLDPRARHTHGILLDSPDTRACFEASGATGEGAVGTGVLDRTMSQTGCECQ